MKHTVNLTTGDWSTDGHSQTDRTTIRSNLTAKQIREAYKRGCKEVGFDLTTDVATDYEDSQMPKDVIDKLLKAGYDLEYNVGKYEDEWENLDQTTFPLVWLFIVGLGDPSFKYEVVTDGADNINIGGYGLFGG